MKSDFGFHITATVLLQSAAKVLGHFILLLLAYTSVRLRLPTPNIIDELYPSNHANIFQNCFEGKWGGGL